MLNQLILSPISAYITRAFRYTQQKTKPLTFQQILIMKVETTLKMATLGKQEGMHFNLPEKMIY